MRDVNQFIDALSRWYLRRSRRRFWKSTDDSDKAAAFQTLWECLTISIKLLAPVIPFVTEAMYQELVRGHDSEAPVSVHLCELPRAGSIAIDQGLLSAMDEVLEVVELGQAARSKTGLKVRQPLAEMRVASPDQGLAARLLPYIPMIQDELNVKAVRFAESGGTPEGWSLAEGRDLAVMLDKRLTDDLVREGWVRDLVRQIQVLRRESGLQVSDWIRIRYVADEALAVLIAANSEYIAEETLALELLRTGEAPERAKTVKLGDEPVQLAIVRV
jgi:isoleucyl-tRNA synthetase